MLDEGYSRVLKYFYPKVMNYQAKRTNLVAIVVLFVFGFFAYFKFSASTVLAQRHPTELEKNYELTGIFEEYVFTSGKEDGRAIFLRHSFITGETREISIVNTVYNPEVLFVNNKVFYRATTEGIRKSRGLGNCIAGRRGIIKCPNMFEFLDTQSKSRNKIAANIFSFAVSENGNSVAYARFDGKKNEIFSYDILSQTTDRRGTYPGTEVLLLKVSDDGEIVLSQDEKLYRLREQHMKLEMIYDPKVGKRELAGYTLFENGNAVLVEKATSRQGIVFETGVFDLRNNQYSFLEAGTIDSYRLTVLPSPTKDEVALYQKLRIGFDLAIRFTPDRKHILFLKLLPVHNFYIKPEGLYKPFIRQGQNVYFLGWMQ